MAAEMVDEAAPSNTTANNVVSSGDTTQNDDILAHDVEFRKRNCELGLSKAYARHYRCKGSACFVSSFTNNLIGFTCMRECLPCRFGWKDPFLSRKGWISCLLPRVCGKNNNDNNNNNNNNLYVQAFGEHNIFSTCIYLTRRKSRIVASIIKSCSAPTTTSSLCVMKDRSCGSRLVVNIQHVGGQSVLSRQIESCVRDGAQHWRLRICWCCVMKLIFIFPITRADET